MRTWSAKEFGDCIEYDSFQHGNARGVERLFKMRLVPYENEQNSVQFSNQNLQPMSSTLSEIMFFFILVNWRRLVSWHCSDWFILRHGTLFFFERLSYWGMSKVCFMDSWKARMMMLRTTGLEKARWWIVLYALLCCDGTGFKCEHIWVTVFGLVSDCSVSGISARCPRCHCNITEIQRVSCSFEEENETKSWYY